LLYEWAVFAAQGTATRSWNLNTYAPIFGTICSGPDPVRSTIHFADAPVITQVFETSLLFGTTLVNVIQATLDPNGAGVGGTTAPGPASSSQQRHTS
jgi:hypothetical protein